MSYQIEQVRALTDADFRRLLGVKSGTFEAMLAALKEREVAKKKRGRPPDLSLEQQLLLTLQFWREYRTQYHLAMEWQVAENTVRRTIERVENTLVKSGKFSLPARPKTGGSEQEWSVVIVDVTERPVERPKKAAQVLLGQKKRHTLKSQVAVDKKSGAILAAACGKGREHDFRLFKRSKLRVCPDTELLADSGYQGLAKLHPKSRTPHKRWRKKTPLTPEQRAYTHALASERVLVENVIRRLKVFRVLKETYRHRRRRHGLRTHLLAGLYNRDLMAQS